MNNKIKAIEEYLKYFPNDYKAKENLLLCKYAEELEIDLKGYYPKMEHDNFLISNQIMACKYYNLTNSKTNYKFNKEDTIIVWRESCGKLAFAEGEYYWTIDDEWNYFKDILKSYNPVDYDEYNDVYVYDLENGKKLINDYDEIIKDFKNKINKKIENVKLKAKELEFERLKKELNR